jgi:hypothetical protein
MDNTEENEIAFLLPTPKNEGRVEKYHSVVQFDVRHIAIAVRRQIRHGHRYEIF